MATSQASYNNVYVPGFSGETTAKLIVDFSRNPKDFPVNAIAGTITVKTPSGYFLHLKPEAQGRIINSPQSYEWADGAPCPIQVENGQDFEFIKYFTKRVVRSFPLGYMTAEFAAWDIEAAQARILANQIMTMRANAAYVTLQASGSYLTGHVDTATNWGGGLWGSATSTNRYIQKTINRMRQQISKATFDTVKASDFILVMSPVVADATARTAEIADYMSNSVTAKDFLTYEVWQSQTQNYGLPPSLYGVKLLVDSSVKSTNLLGGTDAKAFLPGDNSVYMVAKPGSLSTPAGGESFGALTFFVNSNWEMRTETIDQPIDARKVLRVTDMWDVQMTAKEAAASATAVLS
jgi:hypothetical protein